MPKRNGAGIALMADPTRRRIIVLLAQHPRRPKRLAAELGLGFPAVSRQLGLLCEAGLVLRKPTPVDGRGWLYRIDPHAQARILAWLAGTEVGIGVVAPERCSCQIVVMLAARDPGGWPDQESAE